MAISANVTNTQITATVKDDKITATVSGGIGPQGPQGIAGATDYGQLTNVPASFTPSQHASTHGASGSDPITVTVAQVSGLQSALGSYVVTTDSRLSDAREWSAATATQAEAEAGTATDRRAFTPLRVFQAIAAWWAGSAAKTKLDGIASGATANQTDAYLLDRSHHTGTQVAATISDFTTAVIAAAPPTTNASLLTSGTLPDAQLSSNIARTADVSSAVAALVNSSPAALDTLGELAAALGNDASFSATVTNSLAAKAPLASPTFTGTVSGITKSMVGLGNVDNTSDASKPVSTAQAAADAAVASAAASDATTKANAAQAYAVQRANHTGTQTASTISDFSTAASAAAPVQSVAGRTGSVVLSKSDVSLGNVDNTADSAKPVSTAQAAADAAVQAYAIQRANHTGTQAASTITGLAAVATSGSASDLGTGTLAIGRIPTGTTSSTVCIGNDSRLSDARTPTSHASSHASGGSDPISIAASQITSGTVATARLGSGTASSTTVLYGDSSWKAIPSGGSTNVWIPASAFIPRTTNGAGVDSVETSSNTQNFDQLTFDPATAQFADALVTMPSNYNSGTVTARFYWTASSGSGDVIWRLSGLAYGDNGALDTATGTAQSATDTLQTANAMHVSPATSAITISGTPAANKPVQFTLSRNAPDAGDTLAVNARFLGVEIAYTAA